ncbi:hypothetical protein QBC38DRAFT_511085 [Podospora fimiseda]|uniref:Uncharacterized protein n=1 Tax=Podospora fimiseda TaxID=252190 RepID=A0AAN7GRS5_9PEZI|nr:hypothetical protein QBC38DRAFT_511085 [Podospora fimiseda]
MASHLADILHASSQDTTTHLQKTLTKSKSKCATSAKEEPQIPDPKLFTSLQPSSNHPNIGQCATHLALLEAFFHLRLNILKSSELDTVFNVQKVNKTIYKSKWRHSKRQPVKLRDPNWDEKRNIKWLLFLSIAVARFQVWAIKVNAEGIVTGTGQGMELYQLPPIDILMVWHAFLLNPLSFKKYCKDLQLVKLRRVLFPWPRIHKAINPRLSTFNYDLPIGASTWFRTTLNLKPDLFDTLKKASKLPVDSPLAKSLSNLAFCATQTTIEPTSPDSAPAIESLTIAEMASTPLFDSNLSLLTLLRTIPDFSSPSPLVSNVQRQSLFVDKMHRQLWIRSPSAHGTLSRAIDRYERFIKLFSLYPKTMLVPTLDIDLVWHTHQLSAEQYETYMRERTGRYINHDDTIQKNTLGNGMDRTANIWRVEFGEDYEGCRCWDCEVLKDELERDEEDVEKLVERVKSTVEYYRVVEIARRKGWEFLPLRE